MADKVFINGMAAVHAGSSAQGIAMPDVCLCPPSPPAGPIPTPLPNTFKAADLTCGASTVTIEGNPVGNMNSYIKQSTGNAVSRPTGGGVISHAVEGAAYPLMGSFDVFIESSPALKVFGLWTANHMPGAKMPPNTPPAPLMGAMSVPAMAPKTATKDMSKGKKDKKSWVRFVVVDKQGLPVAWVKYAAKLPDGRIAEGRTPPGGTVELRGFSKGDVELTFPGFDAKGWVGAKEGPETARGGVHRVRPGETATRVAWKRGFCDVKVVWDHPDNRELVKIRKDPNVLAPGDRIAIPARKSPVYKLAADKETNITVNRPKERLYFVLKDVNGKTLADTRFELCFNDGQTTHRVKGTTASDGTLDKEVPLNAAKVRLLAWPKGTKAADLLAWDLSIGGLDPVTELDGIRSRLGNLGFDCGGETGDLGPKTEAALEAFRMREAIDEEDLLGPKTIERLETAFGA